MTPARGPDSAETIARAMAICERRLRESVAEPITELRMTQLEDVVADVDNVLGPVIDAFTAAAAELNLPAQTRNHRTAAAGTLSLILGRPYGARPRSHASRYGTDDLPTAWPEVRGELISAVERALARLESRSPTA